MYLSGVCSAVVSDGGLPSSHVFQAVKLTIKLTDTSSSASLSPLSFLLLLSHTFSP